MNNLFDKNGEPTKKRFRIRCDHRGCKKYIIGRWGGGYGCITTTEGTSDSRNQVWLCKKHSL